MQTLVYFLISLIGASLLFMVQPMAAKAALPILGGAPFVWNGCMLFFQALLLLGYLYAHQLNRLPVSRQPWVHLPLLALALLAFPISFAGSSAIDAAQQPMLWLLGMLALSVGLPFFVLSATSPLSQRWFAAAAPTKQPYALYAASNLGSFAGLLAYPTLIEPNLPLVAQASLLHYGFILLLALFAIVGIRHAARPAGQVTNTEADLPKPAARTVGIWILLSFVPASLLYGVTTYITTDIASVPLFWVIPLALYLLTFVLIFGNRPPSMRIWRVVQQIAAPAMALLAVLPLTYPMPILMMHLLAFFAATMMCHHRLCALKPHPTQLTGFFLWVSLGGVLGGIFNTLLAPLIFTSVIEYPLMLIASVAIAGLGTGMRRPSTKELVVVVGIWAFFAVLITTITYNPEWMEMLGAKKGSVPVSMRGGMVAAALCIMMMGYFRYKPEPLGQVMWMAPGLLVLAPLFNLAIDVKIDFAARNVFGVSRVIWQQERNAWVFRHGTTYHGVQSADETLRLKPTSYYGPLIDVHTSLTPSLAQAPVAVIGMGVGTVACYGHPKQHYDLFEIDPLVERIANDTRYFTYLRDCPPQKKIVIGDGRISIGRSADKQYGLIIMDAFSSDSIPMHLITREAVALYASKLRDDGLIAFNISNRHVDLVPVLSAIANDLELSGATKLTIVKGNTLQMSSRWLVLTKNPQPLKLLQKVSAEWESLPEADEKYLWRDDYSNILRSMHR